MAITVRGGVVDDVSEVVLTIDRGLPSEAVYRLDAAATRGLAYRLREGADLAERCRRGAARASAGGLIKMAVTGGSLAEARDPCRRSSTKRRVRP